MATHAGDRLRCCPLPVILFDLWTARRHRDPASGNRSVDVWRTAGIGRGGRRTGADSRRQDGQLRVRYPFCGVGDHRPQRPQDRQSDRHSAHGERNTDAVLTEPLDFRLTASVRSKNRKILRQCRPCPEWGSGIESRDGRDWPATAVSRSQAGKVERCGLQRYGEHGGRLRHRDREGLEGQAWHLSPVAAFCRTGHSRKSHGRRKGIPLVSAISAPVQALFGDASGCAQRRLYRHANSEELFIRCASGLEEVQLRFGAAYFDEQSGPVRRRDTLSERLLPRPENGRRGNDAASRDERGLDDSVRGLRHRDGWHGDAFRQRPHAFLGETQNDSAARRHLAYRLAVFLEVVQRGSPDRTRAGWWNPPSPASFRGGEPGGVREASRSL